MLDLLFSSQGRVNRSRYWLAALIYMGASVAERIVSTIVTFVVVQALGENGANQHPVLIGLLISLPMAIVGMAILVSNILVSIKRLHDRNKSGWLLLPMSIPVVGWLWMFVELGCLKGTDGANRFGPDPLAPSMPSAAQFTPAM